MHPAPPASSVHTSVHQLPALRPHGQSPIYPPHGTGILGSPGGGADDTGSNGRDPEDALSAPPCPAWLGSQGPETNSRLGWARPA